MDFIWTFRIGMENILLNGAGEAVATLRQKTRTTVRCVPRKHARRGTQEYGIEHDEDTAKRAISPPKLLPKMTHNLNTTTRNRWFVRSGIRAAQRVRARIRRLLSGTGSHLILAADTR